jgi:hypothetical protein
VEFGAFDAVDDYGTMKIWHIKYKGTLYKALIEEELL